MTREALITKRLKGEGPGGVPPGLFFETALPYPWAWAVPIFGRVHLP
jgi:hypothetical protein